MGFLILAAPVQDALGERLTEALAETAVPCSVGYPPGGPDVEHVWIAGEFEASFPRYLSGVGGRDESAQIRVKVMVTQTADTMAEPRDRAIDLAALCEQAVSDDPTLGGLVEEAHVATAKGLEGVTPDGARQYALELSVAYTAAVSRA